MNEQEEEIEFTEEETTFILSDEEAYQLYDFLEHEYISHEFYPLLPIMMRRLLAYVK